MSKVTLASVSRELGEQPSLLRSLRSAARWSELRERGDPVLVGAGDSYAASLCASFLAGPRVLVLDPYSLAESVGWATGRHVYIVSISGQTRSNVELALSLKGVAKDTTAITCNPKSPLAGAVDAVVEVPFRPRPRSPGVATFTLSLAAALKVCGLDPDCDFDGALWRAAALSKRIAVARGGGVTHFAGNNEAYGVSVYGAAKIYELLGGRAQASLLEEFSHMQLFSLSAMDRVNVIESQRGDKGERLHGALEKGRFASSLIRVGGESVERIFVLAFAMQIASVEAAKRDGLRAPFFLGAGARKKLRISDEMIY